MHCSCCLLISRHSATPTRSLGLCPYPFSISSLTSLSHSRVANLSTNRIKKWPCSEFFLLLLLLLHKNHSFRDQSQWATTSINALPEFCDQAFHLFNPSCHQPESGCTRNVLSFRLSFCLSGYVFPGELTIGRYRARG